MAPVGEAWGARVGTESLRRGRLDKCLLDSRHASQ